MSNNSIDELLQKLKRKIEIKDLSYFYSQKKTISLFEALKYYDLDFAVREDFFDICEKLEFEKNKNGKVTYYYEEEWYDNAPWGEEIPCDNETSLLIKDINKSH